MPGLAALSSLRLPFALATCRVHAPLVRVRAAAQPTFSRVATSAASASRLDAPLAAHVLATHDLLLLRSPDRGRLLAATAPISAGDAALSEDPLVAVASPLSAESACSVCFRALAAPGRLACAGDCGARFCSPACLASSRAPGSSHEALCGGGGSGSAADVEPLRLLDAFCAEHSVNFPRVAAAMLGASLGSGDFAGFWTRTNGLASVSLGAAADEDFPRALHASFRLVRGAVASRLGGDTEGFFGQVFNLRAYARLMGTLRLNAFSVACPIDMPHVPAPPAPAAPLPSLVSPIVSTLAAKFSAEAGGEARTGAAATGDSGGCCSTDPASPADSASCGSDPASCDSHGDDSGSALRAAERAPGGGTALYHVASLLNHSCEPNLDLFMAPRAHLSLRANRAIGEREELTITYVDANLPVDVRRKTLRHGYGFDCRCARCARDMRATGRRL